MQKDGAGAGGAVRGESLATIYRGAFDAHLHHVKPGARKRVGSAEGEGSHRPTGDGACSTARSHGESQELTEPVDANVVRPRESELENVAIFILCLLASPASAAWVRPRRHD